MTVDLTEFEEVEDALREISQREATWGGMLSGSSAAAASPAGGAGGASSGSERERSNGSNADGIGSINGRSAGNSSAKALPSGREEGFIVGVGASNGGRGAMGGDIIPDTRTLV